MDMESLMNLTVFFVGGWGVSLLTAFFIIKLVKYGERQMGKDVFLNSGSKRRGALGAYWILFGLFAILAGAMLALELYYFKNLN